MAYVHCVFFTCKPETAASAVDAQIADAKNLLAQIPTVRGVQSGRRDTAMQREVSVTDFDIGLVVKYDDKAGYQIYADHKLHMDYIGRHKTMWSRVRVFDYEA